MTHEPECPEPRCYYAKFVWHNQSEQCESCVCVCGAIRAAYQRGRSDEFDAAQQHAEDEYKRGRADERENAGERVERLPRAFVDDIEMTSYRQAVAAARGEGEQK